MAEGVFRSDGSSRPAQPDKAGSKPELRTGPGSQGSSQVQLFRAIGGLAFVVAGLSLTACGKSDAVPPTAAECVQMADRMFPEPADADKREAKLERCLPPSS